MRALQLFCLLFILVVNQHYALTATIVQFLYTCSTFCDLINILEYDYVALPSLESDLF